jgi:lipoprotein-anchoring transpeptidase ErfK/SrfK
MALAVVVMLKVLSPDECEAADSRAAAGADTGRTLRRVVVSIPDRKLAVIENGVVIGRFDVAVGKPASPSPVGTFTIVSRVDHPTYYAPGKVIRPGPRNPLGTRWLGLDIKGFGLHGTDEPGSIGHARSHGCIRLRNRDIEALFELVRPGDVVELHLERTPEIAHMFGSTSEVRLASARPAAGQANR